MCSRTQLIVSHYLPVKYPRLGTCDLGFLPLPLLGWGWLAWPMSLVPLGWGRLWRMGWRLCCSGVRGSPPRQGQEGRKPVRGVLSPLEALLPVGWQELTSGPFCSRHPALLRRLPHHTFLDSSPSPALYPPWGFQGSASPTLAFTVALRLMAKENQGTGNPRLQGSWTVLI